MTDPDEKLRRHYRELAREEPGAVLDAAILAAARRAAARPSAARRWGPPVSIAAVLMLAVGVSLNMQREEPGVEYREPARPSPPPAAKPPEAPAKLESPAQLPMDRVQSLERRDAAPALRSQPAAPSEPKREEKFAVPGVKSKVEASSANVAVEEKPVAKKDTALTDSAAERPAARPYFVPDPAAPASPPAAAPVSPPAASVAAPSPAPARAATSALAAKPLAKATPDASEPRQAESVQAPAVAGRMKEADSVTQGVRAQAVPPPPEQELERIARLRLEGRHADADKALEEFRRRYPDYRISPAMYERVKPP